MTQRESMEFDVLIIGGGPAGLAAAIHLKQLQPSLNVCLIDKGSEIGAHILSGAVMDPHALDELLPNWRKQDPPVHTAVTQEDFYLLNKTSARKAPNWLLPASLTNKGNLIISLGSFCRWLGRIAEAHDVEVFPGFVGTEILFSSAGAVIGVATGDMALLKDGSPGPHHQAGINLLASYTLFAEGCRGHLGKMLEEKFALRKNTAAQTYSLGIKELWQIPTVLSRPGTVIHTVGWPMEPDTYGGGFAYHLDLGKLAIGFVVGLGYENPYLSPFEEFQRYKQHPFFRPLLQGGKRLSYGARALVAGGLQSLPQLTFAGGALIGDDAGFLNAARIKGSHTAIKSGMLAALACVNALAQNRKHDVLDEYPLLFKNSWLYQELYRARNFKPWLAKAGLYWGSMLFGIDQMVLRGRAPWTLKQKKADHLQLKPAHECTAIKYPPPDGAISFDRLSSVFLSNTHHAEDQPCHLQLRKAEVPISINLALYDAPEQHYCPAGVYEIINAGDAHAPQLQINAQNCVHCKTCDIKDPTQNINWVPPMGGEGPIYQEM